MRPTIKFVNTDKTQFFNILRSRVDNYFLENKISQHANGAMVFKTIFMIVLYFVPYIFIVTQSVTGWSFWLSWIIMGLGLAGIGMSIMHDANHGAYSSSNLINKITGRALNVGGGDSNNWKLQHNILHHTYTNIQEYDEDIDAKAGMRFSPNAKHKPIQRFQIVYVFFFYSLMTLYWTTLKDFMQFSRYGKEGVDRSDGKERLKNFFIILNWKIFYLLYILIVPIFVVGIVWWKVLLGFLLLHMVAGLILSITFQLAHVVEGAIFPLPDEKGNIETEWAIHQMQTTANFAKNNWLLTFYLGGLNFQVIHHLFPRICHIHYPKIEPIIEQTAKEFGVPYIINDSFISALRSHLRTISKLGRNEISPTTILNNMG